MNYRVLGNTGLKVSEIGLGAEWLERMSADECTELIDYCEKQGINLLDCWMSEPNVRSNIGAGLKGRRDKWIIQGHIGATWNGQYVRTREVDKCRVAFEDLLTRFNTDYIDLGMIHYVDTVEDYEHILNSDFLEYVRELKSSGKIRHVGMSTHNPDIAKRAVADKLVEMIMFSVNPAFDILPAIDDVDKYFEDIVYDGDFCGMAPERAELYKLCEREGVGITVMKGYAGGRLFDAKASPFGVALTPVQCLHYSLTRPAVASVLVGFGTPEHVDDAVAYTAADDAQKDYATVLASAPRHAYRGQCTYCGHCRPCPKDIDIAMVNKLYDLAVMQDELPASIREHYKGIKHGAAECISCRACETRCPFGVKIADRMAAAKKIFVD